MRDYSSYSQRGDDVNGKRIYSMKNILIAICKSALYLLFFLAVQFFVVVIYGIVVAANAAINGETDLVRGAQTVANQLLGRVSALTLIACLLTVAVLLSWFWLRKRPLEDATSLRPCSRWTMGFCIFGAMGLFVLISLVLYLLPERWMAEYGKAMTLSTETGLIPALAMVVGAPIAEELVFRGIIQSRLERSLPAWIAVVLQAVLFGLIHGTPVQIGYAFIMGLLFGLLRWRTGSILPTLAAHAAFNAMNDPLGLLGDFAESWYFLVVIIAVSAAGCVLCRRGLVELKTKSALEEECKLLEDNDVRGLGKA